MLRKNKNYIGAGIVFITPQKQILMLKKHNDKLTFPGGHKEKEEVLPYETAIRECKEELGQIPNGNILGKIKIVKQKNGLPIYSFFMSVKKKFVPTLSDEHKEYIWEHYTNIQPKKLTSVFKPVWKIYKKYISTIA